MNQKVIITAALAGAASFKDNNPAVPYTPEEFAEEAYKAHQAGAAMVHVHARREDGFPTHEIDRIQVTYDANQIYTQVWRKNRLPAWIHKNTDLPAMAFEADESIIRKYFEDALIRIPVDPYF